MYLVDTSVWIDFLRGRQTAEVSTLVELLGGEDVVGIAPIILQEVLQGADSEMRLRKWQSYFTELECYVSADPIATHVAATRLYQQCRRAGRTPRSSNDCLIAATAIEHSLILLHRDRDFELIGSAVPELTLY